MNEELFLKKIKELLLEFGEEDTSAIGMNSNLMEGDNGLFFSSIDYVEFLVEFEKRFGVAYNFEKKVETISDLYEYVKMEQV